MLSLDSRIILVRNFGNVNKSTRTVPLTSYFMKNKYKIQSALKPIHKSHDPHEAVCDKFLHWYDTSWHIMF